MKIDLFYGLGPDFGPLDHEELGIGGTENFITYSAEYLALAGHDVRVYNKIESPRRAGSIQWVPLDRLDPIEERDVLLAFRAFDVIPSGLYNTGLVALALADTESYGLGKAIRNKHIDLAMFVSHWQAEKIVAEEGLSPNQYMITSNGVSMQRFDEMRTGGRQPGKCVHLSTPERGLGALLDIWPKIQKRVGWATLHLFSSFKGWKVPDEPNADMCRDIYRQIEEAQQAGQKIINHRHVNAYQMRMHLLEAELFLYPTRYFNETCCISAIEAAAAGVPIVATARAALKERVEHSVTGYLVEEGEDHDQVFADYVVELLAYEDRWSGKEQMSKASVRMAREYDYAKVVQNWVQRWESAPFIRR